MRFDPTFVDVSASRVPSIPDGLWYLNLIDETANDDNIIGRLKLNDYSGSSGRTQTTDSYYTRTKDDRKADDRIYRLRYVCLLYTSPSPRDVEESRMPSSA